MVCFLNIYNYVLYKKIFLKMKNETIFVTLIIIII